MSSTPVGRFEPESRGNSATIGKAVKINGQIHSKEDLYVDGDVEGTVEAPDHKLTIGPNGTVHAMVKAREVVALGSIQGNVEATDKIEIRKDAKLTIDVDDIGTVAHKPAAPIKIASLPNCGNAVAEGR